MYFFKIWGVLFIIGIIFFPITSVLFKKFNDKGWMFSKIIGLGLTSLIVYILSYIKILKFTTFNCYIIIGLVLIINIIISKKTIKNKKNLIFNTTLKNILISEIIFSLAFISWTFIRSYEVAIDNTTEQFMNYGFMNKIMCSDYMPPEDIWFSGYSINYYYYGQYLSAFITKISFLNVNEGYNIMLALVASLTFMLPFSIAYNIGRKLVKDDNKIKSKIPYIMAIVAGLSICIGGTLYYPIYRFMPKDNGQPYYYWDATRYIGYRPETNDKTITDTPSYSNIAGDLHAHYVDTMFVFVALALLLALMFTEKSENNRKRFLSINIIFLGLILGIQKMTNYWDFPIYLVIISAIIITNNIIKYKITKRNIFITFIQILEIIIIEELVTFPFSRDLYISATKVNFTHISSPLYKMLVLWGLPAVCLGIYTILVIHKLVQNKQSKLMDKIRALKTSDIFIFIIGICALGLIILPEIIYLKDIYSDEFKRANTMFKLTYQAFILFSFSSSYIIIKLIYEKGSNVKKAFAILLLLAQISTWGYGLNAIKYEMKNYTKSDMSGSELFIKNYYPDDYDAIQWIKENIDKDEIIVESVDGSYTISSRISVFTGNPTVLGWHGHEWIWRAENYKPPEEENERWKDINGLYLSNDIDYIKNIIKKYNISYIYLGNVEYGKNYNFDTLLSIGEVVYDNKNEYRKSPVFFIKVK